MGLKPEVEPNVAPADPAKVQFMLELVLAMFPVTIQHLQSDSQKDDDEWWPLRDPSD